MRNVKYLLLFFVIFFFSTTPLHAKANTLESKRAIVFFQHEVNRALLEENTEEINFIFDELPAAVVDVTDAQKSLLAYQPDIQMIQDDQPIEKSGQVIPWGYKMVGADRRVPSTLSGKGIKIGIIDSGVDTKHPDLQIAGGACMMRILDLRGCSNSYNDDAGHGTHVAGVIGAKNNSIGVVGIAPQAQLYSIKVLDKNGIGTISTVMAGIEWGIQQKLDILNISITASDYDEALERMIKRAYDSGLIIVAAAGNEGPPWSGEQSSVQYPAKFNEVIAVSSIDKDKRLGDLSSTGSEVELAAPGENIYSTVPASINASGYGVMSGTSMATPYVTGLVALYKEKYPEMTNRQIRTLLQKNTIDLGAKGRDNYYGYGLAQIDKQPINGDVSVPYTTDGTGKITFNTSQLTAKYTSFDVYRAGKRIASQVTANEMTDYATKGTIEYHFYPSGNPSDEPNFVSIEVNNPGPAFKDLSLSHWYNRYMTYLYHEQVLQGYPDRTIQPTKLLTRGEAAILVGRAIGVDTSNATTKFTDIQSTVSAPYVAALADKKIISGYSDGTFRPNEQVTRAQMAILIAKAYEVTPQTSGPFKDVTKNVTGNEFINALATHNIVSGYLDGTFRPYGKIDRASFSVFLAKAENKELR
ncbi:S8 family serine peptidase [Bacillus sp. REN10]|uniref:S8 family peptidase n=1 Tax=Bacillus sp. REN10 TaxID=2782541 RepID=UPI00193B1E70|nr:S8 family serine peptidase [Bacillus sp. REN10]